VRPSTQRGRLKLTLTVKSSNLTQFFVGWCDEVKLTEDEFDLHGYVSMNAAMMNIDADTLQWCFPVVR
jgi:hypothetical protein